MALQDKTVLVLGGGIAGLTTALNLAEEGIRVIVAEREDFVGGFAAHLACKALAACQTCNGCLVEPRLIKALTHPGLNIVRGVVLAKAARTGGGFEVHLAGRPAGGQRQTGILSRLHDLYQAGGPALSRHQRAAGQGLNGRILKVDAVVLATGFQPYPAERKPRYGYGLVRNVITGLDLEAELRRSGEIRRPSDGNIPQRVAFIQCVGSRERLGHNYCSRVCCGYALRLGRTLKHRFGSQVAVFYMDFQSFGHDFDRFLAAARSELELIRCLPSDISAGPEGEVLVQYQAKDGEPVVKRGFDLLVLSVGLTPNPDNPALAELLGLGLNEHDFFQGPELEAACRLAPALPQGLFLAGTAVRPMDVAETVAHAGRAAQEVISYLEEL